MWAVLADPPGLRYIGEVRTGRITHVSGTFCYYMLGVANRQRQFRKQSCKAAQGMILPRVQRKAGIGGPMKPISGYQNTSQVDRGMS